MESEERILVEKARQGDQSAFRSLVEKYQNQVAATVIGMVGQTPAAEDIGQETFIRFYQSLNKFRGESSVGTYLTRIAINLSLNELRRQKRQKAHRLSGNKDIETIPDRNPGLKQKDMKVVVQRALQKLDPKFRIVIVLRFIDGYTTEETAGILGLPKGTVLSRLARAQMKLKKVLTPMFGGPT